MDDQLYTQEEIVHHIENNSTSKFMYTFNKAPRFMKIDRTGKTDAIYTMPSVCMVRKAGIGYGLKQDVVKSKFTPTEFISIKRYYDQNYQPGFKYTFGLARDKFGKQVVPGFKNLDKMVPGPGIYDIIKKTGSESPKYTFRKICDKTETFWYNKYMPNPGPGAYTPKIYINTDGTFISSKIHNIKSANFGRDKSDRWRSYKRKFNKILFIEIFLLNFFLIKFFFIYI